MHQLTALLLLPPQRSAPAGIPLAHVVQNHGWAGFFTALLAACGAALALLALVANAPSYQQRTAARAKAA
jgi:sugar phosphate permease